VLSQRGRDEVVGRHRRVPHVGVALGPRVRTGAAGRADAEVNVAVMVILEGQMITGVSGAERILLKVRQRTAELSWTS
jgi:hypothetical protein